MDLAIIFLFNLMTTIKISQLQLGVRYDKFHKTPFGQDSSDLQL